MRTNDTLAFIFECFEWTVDAYGHDAMAEAHPIFANDAFFPLDGVLPRLVPQTVFDQARHHAGMEQWRVTLKHEQPFSLISALEGVPHAGVLGAAASGLLVDEDSGAAMATYVDDDLATLDGFIAGLALQLGMLVALSNDTPVPRGDDYLPFLADVCSILIGFGVIVANASFIFQQTQDVMLQGSWSQSRGNFTQEELSAALALWTLLGDYDEKLIARALGRGARRPYKRALKELRKDWWRRLARLKDRAYPQNAATPPGPSH